MTKEKKESFTCVDESKLQKTVSANLIKLFNLADLSQSAVAKRLHCSPAAISNYLNPKSKTARVPNVSFLMDVCLLPEVKNLGLDITINDLISAEFDPIVDEAEVGRSQNLSHNDFLGNYYCYFFDQAKDVSAKEVETSRDLRFGVMTFFDERNPLTGIVTYEAYAMFFKAAEREKAVILKDTVDAAFKKNEDDSAGRNSIIRDAFREQSGFYSGGIKFSDTHAFIGITSSTFKDIAMMSFYAPVKRDDHEYIGGIGAVSSVTHGSNRMPAAQKIIISQAKLQCPDEVTAEHLNMVSSEIDLGDQALLLTELCTKMFNPQTKAAYLDDSDRTAIIKTRMNQLVSDYITKNIFSVGTVSKDEDKKVYQLIKQYL
ncbi:MAG: helix-turn-helix transcriptional regulator [Ruminococcus sp.]|nr:helix-turn-helix transcriptional regulator [Ruminococcus sp.]